MVSARDAKSAAFTRSAVSVLRSVLVPTRTVGALSLIFAGIAALYVLGQGNWLQMPRIDAASDAAQMIKRESIWNWSAKVFEGGSMGQHCAFISAASADRSVAVTQASHPNPAAGFRDHFDLGHKPVDQWCKLVLRHCDSPFKSLCSGLRGAANAAWPVLHYSAEASA